MERLRNLPCVTQGDTVINKQKSWDSNPGNLDPQCVPITVSCCSSGERSLAHWHAVNPESTGCHSVKCLYSCLHEAMGPGVQALDSDRPLLGTSFVTFWLAGYLSFRGLS